MGTAQATLNDFITAAVNTYGGASAPPMGNQWVAISNTQMEQINSNSVGFAGEAWVNTSTGEVMVGDRGTVPTILANGVSDSQLAVGAVPGAQDLANQFAASAVLEAQSMLQGTGVSVTTVDLTGHSLGGYESQGSTVYLANLTSSNAEGFSGITYNNVSFDAPGISGISQAGVDTSLYNSYNFSAQGDLIHYSGGAELQGTVDVSLPVGGAVVGIWRPSGRGACCICHRLGRLDW